MTRERRQSRPRAVSILLGALGFLGVSGIAGGIGILGGFIDLPLDWLGGSPFPDYLVPGLALFAFLGVLPLLVAFGLYARKLWAWPGVLAVGIGVLVWFAVQASVVGWGDFLQWFYLLLGVGILLCAFYPSVRRYANATRVVTRFTGGR